MITNLVGGGLIFWASRTTGPFLSFKKNIRIHNKVLSFTSMSWISRTTRNFTVVSLVLSIKKISLVCLATACGGIFYHPPSLGGVLPSCSFSPSTLHPRPPQLRPDGNWGRRRCGGRRCWLRCWGYWRSGNQCSIYFLLHCSNKFLGPLPPPVFFLPPDIQCVLDGRNHKQQEFFLV